MNTPITSPKPDLWPVAKRGMLRLCPHCGKGKLFAGYLTPVETCAECAEPFGHIRADDGPAWLTIILVAHIFAPFLPSIAMNETLPPWLVYTSGLLVAFALILVILPRAKGFFIAMIWRSKLPTLHTPAN